MDWSRELIHSNWRHQDREFDEHRDAVARALHWQMRTGKTKTMVDLACYLYAQGRIDGVLVLAPNNVHLNWIRREVPEHHWLGVPFSAMAWNTEAAKSASYDVAFRELLERKVGLSWYAVNAEATVLQSQRAYIQAFMRRKRFLLIVDETHEWRRPGSKRSQFVRTKVAPRAAAVRNLSGTMIDNNPLHAFAQYEILQRGALGFEKYADYEKHFATFQDVEIRVKGGRKRTIAKLDEFINMDELRDGMRAWTSYVYRDECDDLPELIAAPGEFDLTGQQKRVYNELARNELVRLDDGELLDVDGESGVLTKLQTIRSGFVKDVDGEVHWLVGDDDNPAFQFLLEEVRRTEGKVLIWCRYRLEIEQLMRFFRRHGILMLDYYGGTRPADRVRHEERFRSDPTVKGIIAQPKTCGQGLDFSAGEHIIWFSHTHGDLIGRRQADERCTKMGGRKIAVTDMVGRGTVDVKILSDQDAKVDRADFLTGDGLRELLRVVP